MEYFTSFKFCNVVLGNYVLGARYVVHLNWFPCLYATRRTKSLSLLATCQQQALKNVNVIVKMY
jgi:hypothetical protein